MITIIYGAQGSGKSRRADEFLKHYGCTRIVEEWDGKVRLKNGDLAFTNLKPPFTISADAMYTVVSIQAAKLAVINGHNCPFCQHLSVCMCEEGEY